MFTEYAIQEVQSKWTPEVSKRDPDMYEIRRLKEKVQQWNEWLEDKGFEVGDTKALLASGGLPTMEQFRTLRKWEEADWRGIADKDRSYVLVKREVTEWEEVS